MSTLELDLRGVKGFLVADVRGRIIGRVESPMYGSQPDRPDASRPAGACRSRAGRNDYGPPKEPAIGRQLRSRHSPSAAALPTILDFAAPEVQRFSTARPGSGR